MASSCDYTGCDGAVVIIDDNGVTNPEKTREETYQCEYGHEFVEVLTPV